MKEPLRPDVGNTGTHQLGQELGEDGEESNWSLLHSTRDMLCNVGDPVERVSVLVNLMEKLAFQSLP